MSASSLSNSFWLVPFSSIICSSRLEAFELPSDSDTRSLLDVSLDSTELSLFDMLSLSASTVSAALRGFSLLAKASALICNCCSLGLDWGCPKAVAVGGVQKQGCNANLSKDLPLTTALTCDCARESIDACICNADNTEEDSRDSENSNELGLSERDLLPLLGLPKNEWRSMPRIVIWRDSCFKGQKVQGSAGVKLLRRLMYRLRSSLVSRKIWCRGILNSLRISSGEKRSPSFKPGSRRYS